VVSPIFGGCGPVLRPILQYPERGWTLKHGQMPARAPCCRWPRMLRSAPS